MVSKGQSFKCKKNKKTTKCSAFDDQSDIFSTQNTKRKNFSYKVVLRTARENLGLGLHRPW